MSAIIKNKAIIIDFNRTIFDPESQSLYENTWRTLKTLSSQFDLYLVSKNEEGRKEMMEKLDIVHFFKSIHFVDKKSKSLFETLLSQYSLSESYVVGDYIKSEIYIGNSLGCQTIQVKQGKFKLEEPTNILEKPMYVIHTFDQIFSTLS